MAYTSTVVGTVLIRRVFTGTNAMYAVLRYDLTSISYFLKVYLDVVHFVCVPVQNLYRCLVLAISKTVMTSNTNRRGVHYR